MASLLKEFSLAIGLLTSDHAPVALKEGWTGYVWKIRSVEQCMGAAADCTLQRGKWDWKRDERYSYGARLNPVDNRIDTRIVLDNRDPSDADHVCVAAVYYDRSGVEVAVDFAVIYSLPRKVTEKAATLRPSRPVSTIDQVAIGTKQCDPDASADIALARSLQAGLKQK